MMIRVALAASLAALAIALALSTPATAQSDDVQYCSALGNRYYAYVSSIIGKRPRPPPAYISVAISKCQTEAQASIPILEKALTNQQVALPPRG
jgi:hypothetical protein